MLISEIYKKYKIMPQLQMHQLRVASVASQIADNMKFPVDKDAVIQSGLLHDMGNILKFNFATFPENLEPEGLDYWQGVKDYFYKNYSHDEHLATYAICKEIKVQEKVLSCVQSVGFTHVSNLISDDIPMEQKISCYSDGRVSPFGIVSIRQRMNEGHARKQKEGTSKISKQLFDELARYFLILEKQIFKNVKIKPEHITDDTSKIIIEQLKNYQLTV